MPREAITKIRSNNSQGDPEIFNLGALFENVYYSDNNNYNLKNFFEYITNFVNKPLFIQFSENQPTTDSVQVWYKIENLPNND